MLGQPVKGLHLRPAVPPAPPFLHKLRILLAAWIARLLARLLGTADGAAVGAMAARELSLILRSREWHRFLGMWAVLCAGILAVPILYRSDTGRWLVPTNDGWFVICGYALQFGLWMTMAQWSIRRLRRDLYTDRLDELMLSRCSPADIAMGEALASAIASLWLVAAAFPVCLFLSAMGGQGWGGAARLSLSLAPAGGLGVWFGMGWALAFTLRRPTIAISPISRWWATGALTGPAWTLWSLLISFTLIWAGMGLVPGGLKLVNRMAVLLGWVIQQLFRNWNPVLPVAGAAGVWDIPWFTNWLVLLVVLLFMMRASMDSVQVALAALPERDRERSNDDAWIHHDAHHLMPFGDPQRRQPHYRDGGNPVTAFDVALGHRVYLHPFFWTLALLAYFFLVGWSLLVPSFGRGTATVAVLLPATGALLLMSGGVAVSFGWERDRHRWPALAVLPLDNVQLAWGKINGVLRPTLWICLAASLTALLMGGAARSRPKSRSGWRCTCLCSP